jgi:hypothetical protein
VARFLLISKLTMTRHLLRNVVAMAISFGLLYYGIAWAVLRCSHDADHSDHAVAMEDVDATHQAFHHTSVGAVDLDLECVGPNFHTEAMAEASSPPQLDRFSLDLTPHVNNFLTLRTVTGDAATDIWLRAVFEGSRSLAFLIGLPSYLFLSILRI